MNQAIAELLKDERLIELGNYVPSLGLFRAIGAQRDELAHSRLIATLFDPSIHRHAQAMIRELLKHLSREAIIKNKSLSQTVRAIVKREWSRVIVHREIFRVDIVLEIVDAFGGLVVGVIVSCGQGWPPPPSGGALFWVHGFLVCSWQGLPLLCNDRGKEG